MNINYNAFVILSAAKNEKSNHKLGQRYIDVDHDIKVSTVAEIENFFNNYETLDTNASKQKI